MRIVRLPSLSLIALLSWQSLFSQSSIKYNNQQLFLSGANLAWMSFANDIGPGTRDFTAFGDILLQVHNHGGNAVRWWLHTNGSVTPAFNDTGLVIGPGTGTIQSLKTALDIAWQREIGVELCLWSFDMLRITNSSTVVARNIKMLTDTTYTRAYINNCLIPMVDSLKHHPAIIAWEIFNEPEGMSNEFPFYPRDRHVSMAEIQRFVNLCAGAIHRTDSTALVTNGTWSFKALTDVPGPLSKVGTGFSSLSSFEQQHAVARFNAKYRMSLTTEEFNDYLRRVGAAENFNFYSDARLIAAGGDAEGTLDFYSVHYYDNWGDQTTSRSLSPLHHPSGAWGLNKPIVVAEFEMKDTYGVLKEDIYKTLFRNGYAGALAWSWTDAQFSSKEDLLAGMQSLWDNDRSVVDVHGVGADWADVTITSPKNDTVFAASAQVPIHATATVIDDGHVVLVEFFANDMVKIGERTAAPYTITWTNPPSGNSMLTAVATGNLGHKSSSNKVRIQVGTPSTVRLEAEAAGMEGDLANMFVRSHPTASGGAYVELRTVTGKITWTLPAVPAAGTYDISFGYRMSFDTPKTQALNVNGTRVAEVLFDGPLNTWQEKKLSIPLVKGSNGIDLELLGGWIDLDYLAVPTSLAAFPDSTIAVLPSGFILEQNYPNPFNPSTTVRFALPLRSRVTIGMYDILGRRIVELVHGELTAGTHERTWTAAATSGVYCCVMEAESVDMPHQRVRRTIKLVLIR